MSGKFQFGGGGCGLFVKFCSAFLSLEDPALFVSREKLKIKREKKNTHTHRPEARGWSILLSIWAWVKGGRGVISEGGGVGLRSEHARLSQERLSLSS